jgi:hypothetical protein
MRRIYFFKAEIAGIQTVETGHSRGSQPNFGMLFTD